MGGPHASRAALPSGQAGKVQPKVYDHAVSFCCLPLRTAVGLIGAVSFILAASLVLDRKGTEDTIRPFVGGYATRSRTAIGLLDVFALFWGPLAIAGALLMRASFIKVCLGFQVARLVSWLWVYYTDITLLWQCELWATDVNSAAKLFGWNPIVFQISLDGKCPLERTEFLWHSFPTLLFGLYCANVTQQLLAELEDEPTYSFRNPLGAVTGAFFTRSLASASMQTYIAEAAATEAARQQKQETFRRLQVHGLAPISSSPVLMPQYGSTLQHGPLAPFAAPATAAPVGGSMMAPGRMSIPPPATAAAGKQETWVHESLQGVASKSQTWVREAV